MKSERATINDVARQAGVSEATQPLHAARRQLQRRNFPFVLLEEVCGVPASLVDVDPASGARPR